MVSIAGSFALALLVVLNTPERYSRCIGCWCAAAEITSYSVYITNIHINSYREKYTYIHTEGCHLVQTVRERDREHLQ